MPWKVFKKTPEEKTFTLEQILDAMLGNGLPQSKRRFWVSPKGHSDALLANLLADGQKIEIGEACALGQAALNLGVTYTELAHKMNLEFGDRVTGSIYAQNDVLKHTIPEIYARVKIYFQVV